ncbi:MAG: flagellar hook-basal body complex protein [Pseudomonadota bacterium]
MPDLLSKPKVIMPQPKVAVQKPNVILLSLQKVQEEQLSVSSQNMANAMHAGFKGFILSSEECVYKTHDKKKISYVKSAGMTRDLSDGALNMTRNPLDFGLSGAGYFMVQTENGKRYTRNGRFTLDKEGRLITSSGNPVLNQTGSEIMIPKDIRYFTVSRDGTMFINGSNAGNLGVVEFNDQQAMRLEGSSLLSSKEDGTPATKAIITQGAFEESNVSVMDISMKLINIMHRFEEAQLLIKQYEELQKQTMNASSKNV